MTKLTTLTLALCSLAALSGCAAHVEGVDPEEADSTTQALCGHPNLLQNAGFDDEGPIGPSTTVTTSVPGGAGYSAARKWTVFTNTPGTVRTALRPSTRPRATDRMIHVYTTTGPGNGLVQAYGAPHSGPAHVIHGAWVYVVRGKVGIGVGNGGDTGLDAFNTKLGEWQYLRAPNGESPANEMVIYGATSGPTEFFVDAASVQLSPNLLTNPSFEQFDAVSTSTTTAVPGSAGWSAATSWSLFTNTAGPISSEILPSTAPGDAPSRMIRVQTSGLGNGLVQVFPGANSCTVSGPAHTRARALVYVHSGQVGIGTGDGGNTGIDATSTTTGQWELLEAPNGVSPANELVVYATSPSGARFDVAWAEVYEVP